MGTETPASRATSWTVIARTRRDGRGRQHRQHRQRRQHRQSTDSTGSAGLWALHDALFTLNGTFLALALLGLSVGGLRAGLVARWHATLGLTSAVLLFASAVLTPLIIVQAGPLGLLGLVGWLMWVAWVVAHGVTLIRPTPAGRRAVPAAA